MQYCAFTSMIQVLWFQSPISRMGSLRKHSSLVKKQHTHTLPMFFVYRYGKSMKVQHVQINPRGSPIDFCRSMSVYLRASMMPPSCYSRQVCVCVYIHSGRYLIVRFLFNQLVSGCTIRQPCVWPDLPAGHDFMVDGLCRSFGFPTLEVTWLNPPFFVKLGNPAHGKIAMFMLAFR